MMRLLPPASGPVLRLVGPRPLQRTVRRRIDGMPEFKCPECGSRIAANRWTPVDFPLRAIEAHEQGHREGRIFVAGRWT